MSIGYTTGLRALLTARTAISVIGHNLANQTTPGYSRQIALLQSSTPLPGPFNTLIGTGVQVGGVYSVINEALLSRVRTEVGRAGQFAAESSLFANLESILQDLSEDGLSAKLQGLFDGADQAASGPEDDVLRQNFLDAASDLASSFRSRYAAIRNIQSSSLLEVEATIKDVNNVAVQVAALNNQIKQQLQVGYEPGDLKDQRAVLLEQLAEAVGATTSQLQDGTISVSVGGVTVVSGGTATPLEARFTTSGTIELVAGPGGLPVKPTGGRLGGTLGFINEFVPKSLASLDKVAQNLILEANKIHATGVPASGPFKSLTSSYGVIDLAIGNPYAIAIKDAGLPFEVKDGSLTIAVTDFATGDVTHHDIDIDPANDSVGDLLDKLNAIPTLSAFVDGVGKLHLNAAAGFGFDFSARVDELPVEGETFGSGKATLAGGSFPVALANGAQFDLTIDGSATQTVTFNATDFADINAATADEVAAAINAQITGAHASVVDGKLVIQSNSTGANSSLTLADGALSPNAVLNLPTAAQGTDTPVSVSASGVGSQAAAGTYTFVPKSSGLIGDTDGLAVDVFDANGNLVTSLNVGAGYEPGTELTVVDGVKVSFSAGELQAGSGQFFQLEVPGETDSAGILGAFGLNNLFDGTGAEDIALAKTLQEDPSLLSGALGGGAGDGGNFLRLAALATQGLDGLGGKSLTSAYNAFAADVGTSAAGSNASLQGSSLVLLTLQAQWASESGVNPDEEFLNLQQFQNLYEAASRYVSVLAELDSLLFQL